jgi:hypothetical protein
LLAEYFRVLTVALLSFSPHISLSRPDDGAAVIAALADDRYYYPEDGYYLGLAVDQE